MTNREKPGDDKLQAHDEPGETAGQVVYTPLLEDQLTKESAIKSSLEQRGITVITTSGVLVSLLFGLSAVVTGDNRFALPGASRVLLIAALVLFVLAAVGGIISNWPLQYFVVETETFQRLLEAGNWNGPPEIAAWRVAEAQVTILTRARALNELKGRFLLVAMVAQVLAVIALAAAVTCMLIGTN